MPGVGSGIVANRDLLSFWAGDGSACLSECKGGLECLACLDACGAEQLRGHFGIDRFELIVGGFVEIDAVLLVVVPSILADGIEAFCGLSECFSQDLRLLWCGLKSDANSSFHIVILPIL